MAQTPRELMPHESVRHFFGFELRRLRTAYGLSQDRLGFLVLQSGDTIGKVEKAERWPTQDLAIRCDRALNTGGTLARLWPLVERQRVHEAFRNHDGRSSSTEAALPQADPQWWWSGVWNGRPLHEVLHKHDVADLFSFLESRGWTYADIATATGLSNNRVRAVLRGQRRVTSYQELERISAGLSIDRGLLGLAFTAPGFAAVSERETLDLPTR